MASAAAPLRLRFHAMASAAASQSSYSFFLGSRESNHLVVEHHIMGRRARSRRRTKQHRSIACVSASQGPSTPRRAPPGVDTRIHWENEDEGWTGGSNAASAKQKLSAEEEQKTLLGENFTDLLDDLSDSHYEFLGVSATADLEEIKAAYRRLSKEYHPDTTSLPLKTASDKFMKLREVYDVLSSEERRKFYDWTLAQEAASRKAEKLSMRLEDPYEQDIDNYQSVPDMVDRLGGRNMELSEQAVTALTIDAFIIVFAICCIVYVIFFKEPYY